VDSSTALYAVGDKTVKPFTADFMLNGKPFSMELDTGATVSIISKAKFHQVFPNVNLQHSNVKLHAYSGESISILGQLEVDVIYGNQQAKLPLVVVSGNGPSLFGRDWMLKIQLNWTVLLVILHWIIYWITTVSCLNQDLVS